MRAFLISLSLLVITAGLCIWNFAAIVQNTTHLYTTAEALPTQSSDLIALSSALQTVRHDWDAHKRFFAISISRGSLVAIELALTEAETAALADDLPAYLSARSELLLAISHLQALEHAFL